MLYKLIWWGLCYISPKSSLHFFTLYQIKYSPRRLNGFGLTDGEVLERLWSFLRRFGKMTKEMRPNHRVDVLTDALLFYGKKRSANLGSVCNPCLYCWDWWCAILRFNFCQRLLSVTVVNNSIKYKCKENERWYHMQSMSSSYLRKSMPLKKDSLPPPSTDIHDQLISSKNTSLLKSCSYLPIGNRKRSH